MYKLVVVAGKLRGEEYELANGENTLGRDSSCDIHFEVEGVSKKHLSIKVNENTCYLEDLNSSNGTFLNGKGIKGATVQDGDKIALPNTIIQIVYVSEKKVLIHKKSEEVKDENFMDAGRAPDSLVAKIFWAFKHKIMPVLHGINEEYEWQHLLGILYAVFAIAAVSLTIFPALKDSKNILLLETSKRGSSYADMVARTNNRALERGELDKIDTSFIKNEDGVKDHRLFDMDGRIVRPLEKLNTYVADPFFVNALNWAQKTIKKRADVYVKLLDDGEIGIAKKRRETNTE